MGTLQDKLNSILQERLMPLVVCKDLLRRALESRGLHLAPHELESIATSIVQAECRQNSDARMELDVSEEVGHAVEEFIAQDWQPLLNEYEVELLENAERDAMGAIRQAATIVLERIERDHLRQLNVTTCVT